MSLSADDLKGCLYAVVEQRGAPNHALIRKLFTEIRAVTQLRQSDSADLRDLGDDLSAREVAEMLIVSKRTVQRRYRELGGQKLGNGILVFHEAIIREHMAGRR